MQPNLKLAAMIARVSGIAACSDRAVSVLDRELDLFGIEVFFVAVILAAGYGVYTLAHARIQEH